MSDAMPTQDDNAEHFPADSGLTIDQLNAIDMLVLGHTDGEVAKLVGLSRPTVTDWRNHNAAFAARLNERRNEVWGSHIDRLRNLIGKAIDVLEEDLNSDNQRIQQGAAVHLLKTVGVYSADLRPSGPMNEADQKAVWQMMRRE